MTKEEVLKNGFQLIAKASAAYLTTIDSDGFPVTRAMLNLRNPKQYPHLVNFFKNVPATELYFTTNTSSAKLREIQANPKISVYFCDAESWQGFMCQGNIEIVDDTPVKHEIWLEGWKMYYPEGKDSEDYTILKLRPKYIKSYHKFNQDSFHL